MKKMIYMMALGVVTILVSSCSSISKSGVVAPVNAVVTPSKEFKADMTLDGNQKLNGKAKQWYLAGIRISGGKKYFENLNEQPSVLGRRTSKAQACAMYDALENGKYDMLVNPQYNNIIHSYFFGLVKRYDVTVNGYGATIDRVYQK